MKPEVLLVASIYDFSADLVTLRLRDAGVPYLRINKEHLPEHGLSLDPVAPSLRMELDGGEVASITALRSVWYRQPVFLRNTPSRALSLEQQLARSQWAAFLRALSVFDTASWMNWPQATYLAECKPYQLLAAKRCGFKIPATLVSNDSAQIPHAFPGAMVVKSLDSVLLREGGDCLFTYTTAATGSDFNDSAVSTAPVMVQEIVEGKTDCRITVVGDQIFAVRVLANGSPVQGDWRVEPRESLEYESFQLPGEVEGACLGLLRNLGLSFGGIDLLETSHGYYFLEVNPTGEWGWLCNSDRPIDEAIASWLSGP